jgi:ABC-type antimicrobial peptide transport system permease subunit
MDSLVGDDIDIGLIMDYLELYVELWNASFAERYMSVYSLLNDPEPFVRGDHVLKQTINIFFSLSNISDKYISISRFLVKYFNISNWMDEDIVDDATVDIFSNVSGYEGDRELLYRVLSVPEEGLDDLIFDVLSSGLKDYIPSMFLGWIDDILDAVLRYEDVSIITGDIVDGIIGEYIVENPPPPENYSLVVRGFVDDPAGLVIYLPFDEIQEIFSMVNLTGGLFIKLGERSYLSTVKDRVYDSYEVLYIEATDDIRRDWEDMLQLYVGFIGIISLFGVVISSTVIYNTMSINVRERIREYATMRTLGIRIREISGMLLVEHFILVIMGVLLGIPISVYASKYFLGLYNSEFFSFDVVIYSSSYLISSFILLIVLLFTTGVSLLFIRGIDLPRIIKESSV